MTSVVLQQGGENAASSTAPRRLRGVRNTALIAAVLTGVAVFLAYLPFLRINPDPHHDGLVLKTAMDVAHGQTLYLDTFDQYGPFFVAVNAITVKIFGGEIVVLRLLCLFMLATTAGLVVWAARMFLTPLLAAASVLLWLVFDPTLRGASFLPWSSIHALLWSAVVLTCLVEVIHRTSRRRAVAFGAVGGIAVAAVVMNRTPTGFATAGAVFLALVVRHRYLARVSVREVTAWLAGFVVPLLVFGLWLIVAGAARAFREQMLTLPRRWYSGSAVHGSVPVDSGGGQIVSGFTDAGVRIAILSAIVIGAIVVWRAQQTRTKVIGGVGVVIGSALAVAMSDPSITDLLAVTGFYAHGPAFELPLIALAGVVAVLVLCERAMRQRATGVGLAPDPAGSVGPDLLARRVALATASLMGLAGVVQYYPLGDTRHLFWGMALVITPAVGVLYRLGGRVAAWVVVAALCVALGPSAVQHGHAAVSLTRRPAPGAVRPLAHLLLSKLEWRTDGRDLEDLAGVLSEHPDAPVLLFDPDALPATMASNLANASPYFVEWGPLRYPALFGVVSVAPPRDRRAINRFVERERPVAWFARDNPKLDGFLRRHRYRILHEARPGCDTLPWACPVIAVPREWPANGAADGS